MKKRIAVLVIALLLAGYVAAGPFLAADAIGKAVQTRNSAALGRLIDFPPLRASLKAQLEDYVVRRAGPDIQADPFGAIALRIASGVASGSVDTLVTPVGIGAILEGRQLWQRASGADAGSDESGDEPPSHPLQDASHRFESPSRFTATVHNDAGEPVVFVLTREGLRWKLSDIRLPLAGGPDAPR